MNAHFVDVDYAQEKKNGQHTFGDDWKFFRNNDNQRLLCALSDGLGSGVKANIMATMTTTMLLKFIQAKRDIVKAAEVVMSTLPICQVRKIAYATFTVIDCQADGNVQIIEEGNPPFLYLRGTNVINLVPQEIPIANNQNRKLLIYTCQLQADDRLIVCSDGVTQAGLGQHSKYKLGLRRTGLINIVQEVIAQRPLISARELSYHVVQEALSKEPQQQALDDITCGVLHFRARQDLLIFTGPPYDPARDEEYAQEFALFTGKKVICGGTTANLISRHLQRPVVSVSASHRSYLPGYFQMEGVDLVTEGVLTLTKCHTYLQENTHRPPHDGASKLMELLLQSDRIFFTIGVSVNQAHLDPEMPIELDFRKNLIRKISDLLTEKFCKEVRMRFI